MQHRHLNHSEWTCAAIDSCIERGTVDDWRELLAAMTSEAVRERILRCCVAHRTDPYHASYYAYWEAMLTQPRPIADDEVAALRGMSGA